MMMMVVLFTSTLHHKHRTHPLRNHTNINVMKIDGKLSLIITSIESYKPLPQATCYNMIFYFVHKKGLNLKFNLQTPIILLFQRGYLQSIFIQLTSSSWREPHPDSERKTSYQNHLMYFTISGYNLISNWDLFLLEEVFVQQLTEG